MSIPVLDLDNSPAAYDAAACDPATETCGYMLGPSSDYLGGHITVWLVSVFNALVPFLIYWYWKEPIFYDDLGTRNIDSDFKKAWRWFGWGSLVCFAGQAVWWPLTFLYNNYVQLIYLSLWSGMGFVGALAVDCAVIALLIKAAPSVKAAWDVPDAFGGEHDYDGVDAFETEVWTSVGVVFAWEGLMGILAFWFFWDTVLFMLPRTLKKYYQDRGRTYSFGGVEYDF